MIKELDKVIAEARPGMLRKSSHLQIVARAARAIYAMTGGAGVKVTKTKAKIHISLE